MKEYIIQLPNEKAKTYKYVTLFILLINCLVFGFVFFKAPDLRIRNISLPGLIISAVGFILLLIRFYTKKFDAYRPGITFIILCLFWLILGNYLPALCMLCFAVFEFYTSRKFKVIFSTDKILYPSFPLKTFLWTDVSNVVLKDDVLTIDLKSNKLIQAVIEKSSADEIDEDEFNEFCRQQMPGER